MWVCQSPRAIPPPATYAHFRRILPIGAALPPAYSRAEMSGKPDTELLRGRTTDACATAAARLMLWGTAHPASVGITLPRGEMPVFDMTHADREDDWAEAGTIKDAEADPDVTGGALSIARVHRAPGGVTLRAGDSAGPVSMPGLPIAPGEPAINPMPREMMAKTLHAAAIEFGKTPDFESTVFIPGGAEIALTAWTPRLGIEGGLSVLGTKAGV